MKIINTLVLFFLGVTICQAETATAQTDKKDLIQYDIELIIFEDAHARYMNSELWPENNEKEADEQNKQTVIEAAKDNGIEELSNLDKLSLSEIENIDSTQKETIAITDFSNIEPTILVEQQRKINKSSEYKILYYASWRQNGLNKKQAIDIDITELTNFQKTAQRKPVDKNKQLPAENFISGKIKVVLARYLHFYTELVYQRVAEDLLDKAVNKEFNSINVDGATAEIAYREYPLTTHRRMRSKELHYIDHPLVGILVQINPSPKLIPELIPRLIPNEEKEDEKL